MRRALLAGLVFVAVPAGAAQATPSETGGTTAPNENPSAASAPAHQSRSSAPAATGALCSDGRSLACSTGLTLEIAGSSLQSTSKVIFRGGKGRGDDHTARITEAASDGVTVTVPRGAKTGPLAVVTRAGRASIRRVVIGRSEVAATEATATEGGYVFPIQGRYKLPTSEGQRFGGGRNHKGADNMSPCGTPLVANTAGTISKSTFQSAAGNYLVIDGEDGRAYVYMHLLRPSPLKVGDTVAPGDSVGTVGETGRAFGCQLHFEIWTAPGYFTGGEPIDPLPDLQRWQGAGQGARSSAKSRSRPVARSSRSKSRPGAATRSSRSHARTRSAKQG